MFEILTKTVVIAFILHSLVKAISPVPVKGNEKRLDHPTDFAGNYSLRVTPTTGSTTAYLVAVQVVAPLTETIQLPKIIEQKQISPPERFISLSSNFAMENREPPNRGVQLPPSA